MDEQACQLLRRVFTEQYQLTSSVAEQTEQIEVHSTEAISSDSVQSPHDPDCHYRRKGDQQVKGYVANITETSGNAYRNLITATQVEPASHNDIDLLTPGLEASQQVSGVEPNKVHVDGGYQSPKHEHRWPETDMVYNGIQGRAPRYEHELTEEGLQVYDSLTGQWH